jgi:hypothetical protein
MLRPEKIKRQAHTTQDSGEAQPKRQANTCRAVRAPRMSSRSYAVLRLENRLLTRRPSASFQVFTLGRTLSRRPIRRRFLSPMPRSILPRSRSQARYSAERHRFVYAWRPRHASDRHRVCGRDGDSENSVHHRGRRALQDGARRRRRSKHQICGSWESVCFISFRSPCETTTLLGSTTARLRAQRTFAKSLLFCHKHDYREAEAIGHRT